MYVYMCGMRYLQDSVVVVESEQTSISVLSGEFDNWAASYSTGSFLYLYPVARHVPLYRSVCLDK